MAKFGDRFAEAATMRFVQEEGLGSVPEVSDASLHEDIGDGCILIMLLTEGSSIMSDLTRCDR